MVPAESPSVLAKALGTYREFDAPVSLRAHFSRVWVHVVSAAQDELLPVVPDGHVDVQWFEGELRVAGPDKRVNHERVPAGATIVGFRFQPGSAARWLRVPMTSLVDRRVALADIWGRSALEGGASFGGGTPAELMARLTAFLEARARSAGAPDLVAQAVYRALAASELEDSEVTRSLTGLLGISPRGLRRHSSEAFGYGPKSLHRILRFQRFLRHARARGASDTLASLSAETGYADQSHLSRECAEMAGMTPAHALRRLPRP